MRNLVFVSQCNRNAIVRKAMDKIGRAIERIDKPLIFSSALGVTRFLCQDCMIWIGSVQDFDNGLLSRLVSISDKIIALLLLNFDQLDIQRGAVNDLASAPCSFDRSV